jgi:hypothetical protein
VRRISALLNPPLGCLHSKCWPGNAECFHESRPTLLSQRNFTHCYLHFCCTHVPNLGRLSTAIVITSHLFETTDDAVQWFFVEPIYTLLHNNRIGRTTLQQPFYVTRATKTLLRIRDGVLFNPEAHRKRPACKRLLHFTQSVSNDRAFLWWSWSLVIPLCTEYPFVLQYLLDYILFAWWIFGGGGDYTFPSPKRCERIEHASRLLACDRLLGSIAIQSK